jgi:hypothetical protein
LDNVLGLYYFILNIGCKSGIFLLNIHIKISNFNSNSFFQKKKT